MRMLVSCELLGVLPIVSACAAAIHADYVSDDIRPLRPLNGARSRQESTNDEFKKRGRCSQPHGETDQSSRRRDAESVTDRPRRSNGHSSTRGWRPMLTALFARRRSYDRHTVFVA